MITFDDVIKENIKEHNPDDSYRILIIGASGSGKTNLLLNLLSHQPDIEFIYVLKIHLKQNINF